MSSPNTYRDTNSADYLNEIRKHQQQNKNANTNQNDIIPRFILPQPEQLNITDNVTLNNNKHEFSDTLNLSDMATTLGYPKGDFQATGEYQLWMNFRNNVLDASGFGRNGTVTGTEQYDEGLTGNGFDFDGSTVVDLGNVAGLKPALPFALSFDIIPKNIGVANEAVFTNDRNTGNYFGIWFEISSSGVLTCSYGDGGTPGAGSRRTKTGTTTLVNGTKYYVTFVVRGATDMSIILNGTDDAGSYSGTGGALAYSTGSIRVGGLSSSTNTFTGVINNLAVYFGTIAVWQPAYADFCEASA